MRSAPSTPEIRNLQIAERFHQTPWDIEDAPTDRVLVYLHVMGIEGDVRADVADGQLGDTDLLFREGD